MLKQSPTRECGTGQMPKLKVYMAAPRGFCAGVDRAIQIVERALSKYGAPVYVRHEIVHNRYVVDSLKAKGAIFVEELDEIPDCDAPVVFSAHGVPKSVPETAKSRNMFYLDATCPLVTKVHREAELHHRKGREIVLIGHAGHPEVEGTLGQYESGRGDGRMYLVESPADVMAVEDATGFRGLYFVLMGHLSPLDGIGPAELGLDVLEQRLKTAGVEEIILATNPTVEGDGTSLHISNLLAEMPVRITRLARGITTGSVLEFANKEILTDALSGRQDL